MDSILLSEKFRICYIVSPYGFLADSETDSAVAVIETAGEGSPALLAFQVFTAVNQFPVVKQEGQCFRILAPLVAVRGVDVIAV